MLAVILTEKKSLEKELQKASQKEFREKKSNKNQWPKEKLRV